MAYPNHCDTDSSDWYILHADKADCHDYRYHSDNLAFCSYCHGSFLNKTVQMFLIKIRSYEPVVQFLRTLCKAKQCCHIKRNGWQNRKCNSYCGISFLLINLSCEYSQFCMRISSCLNLIHCTKDTMRCHPMSITL